MRAHAATVSGKRNLRIPATLDGIQQSAVQSHGTNTDKMQAKRWFCYSTLMSTLGQPNDRANQTTSWLEDCTHAHRENAAEVAADNASYAGWTWNDADDSEFIVLQLRPEHATPNDLLRLLATRGIPAKLTGRTTNFDQN
eukprot:TRINITY_DN85491_c0_g1_i1.p1 TRINITY_DN85491_c0_g1~~TRINITY_DN85491_c0_g1_i1.p1  ORF type:complete len:140 (+),score=11.65 TRINITY_DN85491_c0_g1_i1:71-490(+)